MINYVKHRATIEKLYEDVCTVFILEDYKDPITKITKKQERALFENQPCRLSFKNLSTTIKKGGPAEVVQVTKLFIAPELKIPAGSKIVVTQKSGRTTEFSYSGVPAVYPSHQEIILKLFEEYA